MQAYGGVLNFALYCNKPVCQISDLPCI